MLSAFLYTIKKKKKNLPLFQDHKDILLYFLIGALAFIFRSIIPHRIDCFRVPGWLSQEHETLDSRVVGSGLILGLEFT